MLPRDDRILRLGVQSDGAPLFLPVWMLDRHCQVLAPTGYGKSRLLARLAQELVAKTSDATIVIDPAGDLVNHLRRWAHENGYQHRLIVIDPRERRLICGLNPMRPWSVGHGLQAGVLRDIIRHALGSTETSASAPLASQWLFNTMFALLECELTMHELVPLLDYSDPTFRSAVLHRLGPSIVRNDFAWLVSALDRSNDVQTMRLANEQLGSTTRRLRQFATNDYLRPMLAGQDSAIDWDWAIDRGKLVLVNLSLEGNALTDEDQRLVGQLVVSSIIRRCFARPEDRRRPVNLIIDEAGRFASPETATVLNEGRKFGLRLVLAHQTLSQLVNHQENDTRLLDAVVSNTSLKVIFGGLGARDAADIGQTLFGHLGDPDKRKLELRVPMQLSRVEERESFTESETATLSTHFGQLESEMHGVGSARASGRMVGRLASSGAGHGAGTALSYPTGADSAVDGFYVHSDVRTSIDGEGTSEAESDIDIDSEQYVTGRATSRGAMRGKGRTRSATRGPMVVPGDPFEVTTSVQFESLEEQLHRHISRMIRQPDRHAVVAFGKQPPVEFRVADVPEPRVTLRQATLLDLRVMRRLPCFAEPARIEHEIAERHRVFLQPSVIEVVNTRVAIERRRAARQDTPRDEHDGDDGMGAGVIVRVRPRTPRGGRSAAPIPVHKETT